MTSPKISFISLCIDSFAGYNAIICNLTFCLQTARREYSTAHTAAALLSLTALLGLLLNLLVILAVRSNKARPAHIVVGLQPTSGKLLVGWMTVGTSISVTCQQKLSTSINHLLLSICVCSGLESVVGIPAKIVILGNKENLTFYNV